MFTHTYQKKSNRVPFLLTALLGLALPALGYVGPGAGFAFAGSFFFIFAAFFLAIFNFLTFPVRALIKFLKRLKTLKNAKYKRVIIIGFDGMDYRLLSRFMKEGKKFPHFQKLADQGTFAPLWSTEPPISPVAWSTFSTGVNPGKHNIFDFLTTDRNTYMPKMAGSDILPPKRNMKLGKYEFPISKPKIELKRKSQSFWKIASEKGIFTSVLRVPFTFPPEKFPGLMVAGLGTPDLRGTQGTFSFFSDQSPDSSNANGDHYDISEGVFGKLEKAASPAPSSAEYTVYKGKIKGPTHPFIKNGPQLETPFTLTVTPDAQAATVKVGKESVKLEKGKLSGWMRLEFKAGIVKIPGIAQWVLESAEPNRPIRLYLSPIHIDPEKPSMPISHPRIFSVYLSKLLGPYATLGMAEDTWAVSERVLSEDAFIEQVYTYHHEREKAFFDTFKKYKNGLIVQVFEATDRIQHMFWRYFPDSGSRSDKPSREPQVKEAILHCYQAMDRFLEKLFKVMKKDDLLMIVSDHGFNAFNRGFHLNSWLHREGYLVLNEGKTASGKWYADVDWSKSRAYGQGLNGIFLNLKGREKFGIVEPGPEEHALKDEIKRKCAEVKDSETGRNPIQAAFKREEIYRGPYTVNAPDIVVGYNVGYRVSWESAVNYVNPTDAPLCSDNTRMWSGDHAFTRAAVPGIFFSNKKINQTDPTLADISPTVLSALGIKPPAFIDGRDLGI
ncbi:MAG: alkaline phosphatase family protein [Candidatus Omnitrophota bacterium]